MDFNEKNSLRLKLLNIKDLYVNKKYDALIKESTSYLNINPKDISVRFMRAKAYRRKEMFNEAIEDLKYNLKLENNAHYIVELYYLYYFLNRYNEALELLPSLYKNKYMNATSLAISEAVMKKQLDIPFKTKSNYAIDQINNYNKEKTLNHIVNSHQTNIEGKSQFHGNIDINYLLELLTENLKYSTKANIQEMLEVHYFAISNIGIHNDVCNFVKVVVIPNTNNIISIYPVDTIFDSYFTNIEYDRSKLFKEDNKVKGLSRIDKFKQKYNM